MLSNKKKWQSLVLLLKRFRTLIQDTHWVQRCTYFTAKYSTFVIARFQIHIGVDDDSSSLGCYTMSNGEYLLIFQRNIMPSSSWSISSKLFFKNICNLSPVVMVQHPRSLQSSTLVIVCIIIVLSYILRRRSKCWEYLNAVHINAAVIEMLKST